MRYDVDRAAARRHHQRAKGNLTYLEFIVLIKNLWANAHGEQIPMLPTGGNKPSVYPCILYGLENRRPFSGEPKMRFREFINNQEFDPDEGLDERSHSYVVTAQRFTNVVSFSVVCETGTGSSGGAELADHIMESFEDFMHQMTPLIKQLGASEFTYGRRYSDTEQDRSGEGIVVRKVAYVLVTERVATKSLNDIQLREIAVAAAIKSRKDLEANENYNSELEDPRYYTFGGAAADFFMTQSDVDEGLISVPRSGFKIYDRVHIHSDGVNTFPNGIESGYYRISSFVNSPYASDIKYTLQYMDGTDVTTFMDTPQDPDEDGFIFRGKISYEPVSAVTSEVIDNFFNK